MELEPIAIEDYKKLAPFFRNQRYQSSFYSLSSLLVWRTDLYYPCGAVIDGMLVIGAKYVEQKESEHLILPVSPEKTPTPSQLRDIAVETGFNQYWCVTDGYLGQQDAEEVERFFDIQEQTEYEDYIYRKTDLANLKGNRYAKKRNLVHQFHRNYIAADRVEVETMSADNSEESLLFLEEWCERQDCEKESDEDLYCEKQAVINAILHVEHIQIKGLLFRVDGNVCAFGMASPLTDSMGVLHFEKAFSEIKGLYQFVDKTCAGRLFDGCNLINKESDMDRPGLAKAKHSYHPHMMVKSYKLTLK